MKEYICKWCNKKFEATRVATYCSANCRAKYRYSIKKDEIALYKKRYYKQYRNSNQYEIDLQNKKVNYSEHNCTFCSIKFKPTRIDKVTCSKKCTEAIWRSNNKDKINADQHHRYHNNISRRLSTNIRSRLNKALNGAYKVDSIIGSLGCTPNELKVYLESQFQEEMSWDNYGLKGWHMDHIKPLDSFDLQDPKQFKQACHYTNLQPLWAEDNLSKGARYAT